MPKNDIAVNARQLADALAAVIPHVSTDTTMPPISHLRIEVLEDRLAFIATDRYTLGCYRLPEPAVKNFAPVLLSLKAAKALERFARKTHRVHEITLSSHYGLVSATSPVDHLQVPDASNTVTFPEWRTLVAGNVDAQRNDYVVPLNATFDPVKLAKFAKAGSDAPIVLHHGAAHRPTVISTTNFIGIIMPMRMPNGARPIENWVPGQRSFPAAS